MHLIENLKFAGERFELLLEIHRNCFCEIFFTFEGDFNNEDDDCWTPEEFEGHVVKEREGKRSLLTLDLQVTLKDMVEALVYVKQKQKAFTVKQYGCLVGMIVNL
ncbi:uncharacterized protein LOC133863310 [Alnus glutinosa]|uniref:uncharacterized protein LOC133863310 n=1 Tax=Alnus glutinosa TaxID=3517 RepID=UPI002D7881CA|nr:uncharacterized protein LOC133863310 [Alnus glutinosa]